MSTIPDSPIRAAIFDAYGTLLDFHGAMAAHKDQLGESWQRISHDWRVKQIEYTWVRTLSGPAHYRDFWTLTREALDFVAARNGISDAALLDSLMEAYRVLPAYPEAAKMLKALKARGIACAILSNGEPDMLRAAVRGAGIESLLDDVISIHALRAYKVAPVVYRLPVARFAFEPAGMAFVSSNPWDAFGAREAGYRVFWINRSGQPDEYGLRASVPELRDLSGLPELLK